MRLIRKSVGDLKSIDSSKSYPGKQISSRSVKPEKAFLLKKQGDVIITDTPNADINGFKAYNVEGSLYSDNKTPSETATGAIFGNDSDASTKDGPKDIFLKTTEISIEEDRNFLREGSIYAEDSDMGNLFKKAIILKSVMLMYSLKSKVKQKQTRQYLKKKMQIL